MILKVPSYYEKFHCIADQCKDNCCYGWEIDIDEGTMDYYRSLGGELGKEITSHIKAGEENTMIMREDGYCPFLNEKKLCDICIKMGEEALSEICTEFPRFTMEYEDVREKILSLACEEVGNIMFSTDEKITWQEHEMPDFCGTGDDDETACEDDGALYGNEEAACEDDASDGEAYDDDEEVSVDADQLNAVSKAAVALLQNRKKPVAERAAEYLLYCKRMQQELYGYHTGGEVSGQEQEQEQAIVQMNLNAKNYTEAAEPMSNIYGALYSTLATDENSQRKSMRYIGSCIGRVFYLLDKAGRVAGDKRVGRYNVYLVNGVEDPGAALENARRQSLAVANDLVRAYGMLDVKLNKSLIDNIMILGLRHAVEPLDPENQPVRWELP